MKPLILIGSFLVPFAVLTLAGIALKVNHMRPDDGQKLSDIAVTYATSWGLIGGTIGFALALIIFVVRKNYLSPK